MSFLKCFLSMRMNAKKHFRKDIFCMSQLEKLKQLQMQQTKSSSMTTFDNLVVVHVGAEPTEHFPKLKDKNGNKIKDVDGSDKRSDKSDGWTYTFVQFATAKTVKIVLAQKVNIELLTAYAVSGKGYDIKNANLIFIEKDVKISNY